MLRMKGANKKEEEIIQKYFNVKYLFQINFQIISTLFQWDPERPNFSQILHR